MDIQLQKQSQFVSQLDLRIGRAERHLSKVADSGHMDLCHILEMRHDERVHMRAVLRDKEERLRRKEERCEQLIFRLRYLELKLEESFCENAPIKRRYIHTAAENCRLLEELMGLREQEQILRGQLARKRPSLGYLEGRTLLHRGHKEAATQCHGDGTM